MISFAATEEQLLMKDMLDTLARDTLRPGARESDHAGRIGPDLQQALAATGLVDLALEPDQDVPWLRTSSAIALEALGRADAAFAIALAAPLGYAKAVMDHGSAAQRADLAERWSGPGLRGAAVLIQEPGFGFDVTAPATRVTDSGDDLVLEGAKAFVPRASECSDFLVVASSGNGMDALLVPADAPGVEVLAPAGTLGLRSLAFSDVRFHDVRLPRAARLGGDNGVDVQALVDAARIGMAAIMTGVAGAVLDHLVPYLKDRVAHGSALAQKQSVAFRLADMAIDIPSMRWMSWRAASAMDKGRPATREARLAQLHCAEQALWITDEGVQMMGGHGYMRENPVERWYRDVRTLASLEGVVGL